jgi:DNA repair protein SbcC/Rad50
MRPVRLEMEGFASYRGKTVVDFDGVEYFVLVGPTGAGKSTVIDAMTFALYGTVPRWKDNRKVEPALAPNVSRGVVRLLFDVGRERYVVVRDIRRSANGQVGVKEARLERLRDRDADPDTAPTEPIAAGSDVTPRVQQLLGLSFDHFCKCVVLPQGEFADFLRAAPRDRQEILGKLLGNDVYTRVATLAYDRHRDARQRADVLGEHLAGLSDATPEAITAAAVRIAELNELDARTQAGLAELAAARAEATAAADVLQRLVEEQRQFVAVGTPDGVAELDQRHRAAGQAHTAATARAEQAEQADSAAQAALSGGPDRAALIRVRTQRAELATSAAAEPGAQQRVAIAAAGLATANSAAAEAATSLAAARAAHVAATGEIQMATAAVADLAKRRADLGAVTVPAGLADLKDRNDHAAELLENAARTASAAEEAAEEARAAKAAAPSRAPLEQARRDHQELAAALAELPVTEQRRTEVAAGLVTARQGRAGARVRLDAARVANDRVVLAGLAGELRAGLTVGVACPVCDQHVVSLPAPREARDAAAARAAVEAAELEVEEARQAETVSLLAEQKANATLDELQRRIDRLRAALGTTPAGLAEVEERLAELDRLELAATTADTAERAARARLTTVAAEAKAVAAETTALGVKLNGVRDSLVAYGAPALGADPYTGWTALVSWASRQNEGCGRQLAAARAELASAEGAGERLLAELQSAEQRVRGLTETVLAATRAEEKARSDVDHLHIRIGALTESLVGAPTEDEIGAELARLADLERAAEAARRMLAEARADRQRAADAATAIDRELAIARSRLQQARDPLVRFGAPTLTGAGLLDQWTQLTTWADGQRTRREAELPAARQDSEAALTRCDELRLAIADRLTEHDVAYDPERPIGEIAASAVATVLERERGEHARLTERHEQVGKFTESRDAAIAESQVADTLHTLLNARGFPRWLVESALGALAEAASENLRKLSGDQFSLSYDAPEFQIVDHSDADARRSVKTLSGGETFQASLALALALSTQLPSLAANGTAQLESLFLDEGFGTLDQSTLEEVAATLENLALGGGRMVGVITHVTALADRVPVRFVVSKDQRTSTVTREDA